MSKTLWKGSALLAPVPAALVTCGTSEKPNVLTIGWTGIVCTRPPMTYISVRPERFSHDIIKESGEFVINLTTSAMCRQTDYCGVKSGRDTNKIADCGFNLIPSQKLSVPIIEQCPVSLECRVTESKPLGSHTMFLAEIIGIDVDDKYIDSKGKLNLQQCGLAAYAHGEYFALGRKLGDFEFVLRLHDDSLSKLLSIIFGQQRYVEIYYSIWSRTLSSENPKLAVIFTYYTLDLFKFRKRTHTLCFSFLFMKRLPQRTDNYKSRYRY